MKHANNIIPQRKDIIKYWRIVTIVFFITMVMPSETVYLLCPQNKCILLNYGYYMTIKTIPLTQPHGTKDEAMMSLQIMLL